MFKRLFSICGMINEEKPCVIPDYVDVKLNIDESKYHKDMLPILINIATKHATQSEIIKLNTMADMDEEIRLNAAVSERGCVEGEVYKFQYAYVTSVYDGDTYTINALHNDVLTKFHMRLYGIDTPEMKDKDPAIKEQAHKVQKYVEELICNKVVRVQILNNTIYCPKPQYTPTGKVKKPSIITEKFGRLLGNVYLYNCETLKYDIDLCQLLVKEKMGYEYFGDTKKKFEV